MQESYTGSDVQLVNVNFSYGKKQILHNLSIDLSFGICGLLGPNGAGKTTLLNVIATIYAPSSGRLFVHGFDVTCRAERAKARSNIGYLPQSFELMNASSVLKNVQYAAWARGLSCSAAYQAAWNALKQVGLEKQAHRIVAKISGGQRQRAGIACVIASQPAVLILDEPTVGLDPEQRIDIRNFLKSYSQKHTVIVSTHLVEDLAVIADRVIVLNEGIILLDGKMDNLLQYANREDLMVTPWESGYRHLLSKFHKSE